MSGRESHSKGPLQLTLRDLDPQLESRIRDVAAREALPVTEVALRFLRRGAGLDHRHAETGHVVGSALDDFVGTWSDEETREVLERAAQLDAFPRET